MTKEYFRTQVNTLMKFKKRLTPTLLDSLREILDEESWRDNSDDYADLANAIDDALLNEGYRAFFSTQGV